jgi:ketosteroid isomerase-like protein
MPQSVTELVESLYEAFGKGDVPYVLGTFAPELVWNEAENFLYADRNPYVGPQAVLEGVFLRLATEWDGFGVSVAEIVASGDTAVALGRYRGMYKASGAAVDAQFVHVWRVADGKIVRFQQYTDTAQFREAALQRRPASA